MTETNALVQNHEKRLKLVEEHVQMDRTGGLFKVDDIINIFIMIGLLMSDINMILPFLFGMYITYSKLQECETKWYNVIKYMCIHDIEPIDDIAKIQNKFIMRKNNVDYFALFYYFFVIVITQIISRTNTHLVAFATKMQMHNSTNATNTLNAAFSALSHNNFNRKLMEAPQYTNTSLSPDIMANINTIKTLLNSSLYNNTFSQNIFASINEKTYMSILVFNLYIIGFVFMAIACFRILIARYILRKSYVAIAEKDQVSEECSEQMSEIGN